MKKLALSLFVLSAALVGFAQTSVPSKMTKGMNVETDEFTHATTYSSKDCPLSVVCSGDSVGLVLALSVSAWDAPIGLEQILILSDGQTTEIPKSEGFSVKELPQRVVSQNASGRFGTSSYKGAQYATRMLFLEEWKADGSARLPLVESLAEKPSKVRFVGSSQSVDHEFSGKEQKKMSAMLALYRFLKGE